MAGQRTARVHLDVHSRGTVEVDGVDLAHAVSSLTLHAGVGRVPVLELEMPIHQVDAAGERVRAVVPDATRAALIELGWTPPAQKEDTQ